VGFPQVAVEYERAPRCAGQTNYSLRKMAAFAWTAAISFSPIPLRLSLIAGVGLALFGVGDGVYAVIRQLAHRTVPGWTSIMVMLSLIGGGILLLRRTGVPRVRATTTAVDYLALILLGIIVGLGIYLTLGVQEIGSGYDYRNSVSVWFRGLFAGDPHVHLISNAPIMYQVHATAAWVIFAVWPFSRLVHAWSYPLWYLWRPYIVYRRRRAVHPPEPGTGGRRWRKIGVPY